MRYNGSLAKERIRIKETLQNEENERQERREDGPNRNAKSSFSLKGIELSLRRYLPHLEKIALLALFYAALAFAYSSIGLLHPEVSHYHEYSGSKLLIEILGHFAFGFAASIPMWDLEISLLIGASAVFIDTDHILSALGVNISGRPDHSFLFVFVSAMIMFYFAQRSNSFSRTFLMKFVFFAPVVVFSHIAYDIFALPLGSTSSFQLFIPFNFDYISLPYDYWLLFEALALGLSFLGYFLGKKFASKERASSGKALAKQGVRKFVP
jgi:hypothetical protein